jgi:hypothetical protein
MDQVEKDTLGLDCTFCSPLSGPNWNTSLKSNKGRSVRLKLFDYFGSNSAAAVWDVSPAISRPLRTVRKQPTDLRAQKKEKLHSSD